MSHMAPLEVMLNGLKALADETRLKIIGLLNQQPHNVGELAQALDLTEPTISHHLAKLREVGLVNLYARGTTRIYRLNPDTFRWLKRDFARIEEIYPAVRAEKPPTDWIDALDLDDYDRKVMKDYFAGERLKAIPTREKKLMVILRWLATRFESDRKYTEPEVNAVIQQVHEDYARLRRELVEQGLLAREGGGGLYWVP